VSIRTLGGGQHPLAAQPVLYGPQLQVPYDPAILAELYRFKHRFTTPGDAEMTDMSIRAVEILRSTIAVVVAWRRDPFDQMIPAVLLWNWKTGVQFGVS